MDNLCDAAGTSLPICLPLSSLLHQDDTEDIITTIVISGTKRDTIQKLNFGGTLCSYTLYKISTTQ